MSLLDELNDKCVSREFFADRKWMHINVSHFEGSFTSHITTVGLPPVFGGSRYSRFKMVTFKAIYNERTKVFSIDTYDSSNTVYAKYGVKFERFEINNPTEKDIILALDPEFLSSRFSLA